MFNITQCKSRVLEVNVYVVCVYIKREDRTVWEILSLFHSTYRSNTIVQIPLTFDVSIALFRFKIPQTRFGLKKKVSYPLFNLMPVV